VRDALTTLPWVESDTITPDGRKRQVKFTVKDRTKFDMDEVKRALGSRYSDGVTLMAGPTSQ
jgi:hypothetical protein